MTLVLNNQQTYRNGENGAHIEKMARMGEPLRRAQAWMTTLRKVNYGLVGRSVPTELGRCIHPARTDGHNIVFDTDSVLGMLRGDHRKGVAGVLGLNYHECSHILYSPSPGGSPLVTRLKYRAKERDIQFGILFMLANCLEDQRIESLFTAKYGRAKHYFTVMCTSTILDIDKEANRYGNASPLERAWSPFVLSMGRMYLQPSLRDGFRRAFVTAYDNEHPGGYAGGGEQLAKDVYAIFQKYASEDLLGTSAAQKRAGDRVADLYDLIRSAGLFVPRDNTGHGEDAPGEHGDPRNKDGFDDNPDVSAEVEDLKDDLADEADRLEEGLGDAEAEGDAEGDEGDEGADAGSEPAQPEDSTGEGSGEEAGEDESISTNSTESGEETTSGESVPGGNGVSQGGDTGPKSIEDLLQDAFDDLSGAGDSALENDDVREEYDRLTEAAEHSNSGPEADIWGNPEENLDYYRRRYGNGDDLISARQTADRCEDVLRRLKADAGAYWVRGVDSGRRINPLKFHGRQPWDQNFWDAHEEGQEDEFDIEAVVLLDQSGSMSGEMGNASAAVWAIHRAFAAIGGRVWVIGFSDGAYGLIRGDARPSETIPTFRAIGGTSPRAAVKEAQRILTSPTCSDKSRYLLTVTDGVWGAGEECDTMIAQMNHAGVITSYVYLDTSGGYSTQNLEHLDGRHFHQCGVNMTDISLLPDLMEQIVRQRLATAAR